MSCECQAGRECKSCRMRRWGLSRRRYIFTPELLEELRRAYCGRKPELTRGLNKLEAQTGWPRGAFKNEAARQGWSTWEGRARCWTPEHREWLREMTGHLSARRIAKKLGRTVVSVQTEASRLGISRRPQQGYNITDLAQVFGESRDKIRRWMERGLFGKVHENGGRRVTEESVQRFIRVHAAEYDLRRVDQYWYKGMAFGLHASRGT